MSAAAMPIDGELTIYRAAELRAALLAALAEPADPGACFEVDLAGVTEFDSAGVQLLLAAMKSARAAGRELRLARPSAPVFDVLETLDLAGVFGVAR